MDATALRKAITLAIRRDEAECVAALVSEMREAAPQKQLVAEHARQLITAIRRQRSGASGVDQLMHEFSLSSHEGVALMCLAEALLRIPDSTTADRLIRDKISHGDWRAHLGHSGSLFVNAASWGLLITGKLVATSSEDTHANTLGNTLTRLIGKGGEPLIRKGVDFAMYLLGEQFVMGENIASALARSERNLARGYTHSFDMLGEAALTGTDAERYFRAYEAAIHAIGGASGGLGGIGVVAGPGISVKLSALHPRYSRAQRGRVFAELLPRLMALALLARQYAIGFNIDAEEADHLELSLDLFAALAADSALDGWDGLGFVVQAYQKRAPFVIDFLIDLARRSRHRLMLRLVKGAYWDSEIKHAQVDGLAGYPVYTRKVHTDLAYLVCAKRLLDAPDAIYPQFATHNAQTLAAVAQMASERGVDDYEFQCLHGMGEALYDNVVDMAKDGQKHARRCRIYAPVGSHETLLPYLVRRLLENGANSSFVNRIVDEAVSIDELLTDPLDQVIKEGGRPHPAIPLPPNLFGTARRNSAGLDLAGEDVIASLKSQLHALAEQSWEAAPALADRRVCTAPLKAIRNPARRSDLIGTVREASIEDVARTVGMAHDFAGEWHSVPAGQRATLLERAADLFESRRSELISLCIREAGKTWGNAVAEIREAVDFCRYYAQQIREVSPPPNDTPPGPVVCISPWNFPLAIFVGQISAALAAGSPVLAKPAEQTPLIAAFAVELLYQAGIPRAALQLLPGRGETVGAALTADPRVRGVIFTGSTEVARLINRSLAARLTDAPEAFLIAETGGQNAMIVDSSALPEQVVQDVLASGFDSAGQRCSALRVLCVQNEIADRLLAQLRETMQELQIGDPGELATDIGPLIDDEAKAGIEAHVEAMRAAGKSVFQLPLPASCRDGSFIAPTLIEIDSLSELQREIFGPVVHVLRFAADQLDPLIDAINATGYGLTFGLHSRIDETIDHVTRRVRAGNLYINRNMVGAVVGVQPFGGEGLSGTGPKAGGPLYLHRLLDSRDIPPQSLNAGLFGKAADPSPQLEALASWAKKQGRSGLANACAFYAAQTFLHREIELPGPTGERNMLRFVPRGNVLCHATTEDALFEQIAATFATGNDVLIEANLVQLLANIPEELISRIRCIEQSDNAPVAAVLFAGSCQDRHDLQIRIAGRSGALLPVIPVCPATGRYAVYRLFSERVTCTNTTAAGGNTPLMTLRQ